MAQFKVDDMVMVVREETDAWSAKCSNIGRTGTVVAVRDVEVRVKPSHLFWGSLGYYLPPFESEDFVGFDPSELLRIDPKGLALTEEDLLDLCQPVRVGVTP